MARHSLINRIVLALVTLCFSSSGALADDSNIFDASSDFSNSQIIEDGELDKHRGGFLDVNGMLVNFSFTGIATINGNIVSQIQIDLANVINAANNGTSNIAQPTIIQNVDNNALIIVQQTIDLQVTGANQVLNNASQMSQMNLQNVFAIR